MLRCSERQRIPNTSMTCDGTKSGFLASTLVLLISLSFFIFIYFVFLLFLPSFVNYTHIYTNSKSYFLLIINLFLESNHTLLCSIKTTQIVTHQLFQFRFNYISNLHTKSRQNKVSEKKTSITMTGMYVCFRLNTKTVTPVSKVINDTNFFFFHSLPPNGS